MAELVCCVAELEASPSQRRCVRLASGRGILVLKVSSGVVAMDALCYHHGGPLEGGDIEELEGHIILKCPWHKYLIEATSGECLYYGLDLATRATKLKSKGLKQRTHAVSIADGNIFVSESRDPPRVESDTYATTPFPPAGTMPPGAPGVGVPIHSSMQFQAPSATAAQTDGHPPTASL
jgi:nitrite reductase/ring-hydroxylating ferredoxin subunit